MINLHKIFIRCSWTNTNGKYLDKMWPSRALHGAMVISLRPTLVLLLTSVLAAQFPPSPTVPPLPVRPWTYRVWPQT